ncbi:MAG: hypothetical protein ACLQU5_15625, partial [Isosphaeraceae bacterium]
MAADGNTPFYPIYQPGASALWIMLQFRRKPAVAGMRRLGVIGLGWVGQGFMQQAARLAQRSTAG